MLILSKTHICTYDSDLFWNHKWQSAQWRALCTNITELNLSAFAYRLFHEGLYIFNRQSEMLSTFRFDD